MDMFIVSWVVGIVVIFLLEIEFFEYFEKVMEQGIKVVLVDWVMNVLKGIIKIVVDDYWGLFEGIQYFIDQGYIKIVYLLGLIK